MKTLNRSNATRVAILLLAILAASQVAQSQTLVLQLQATNYNATTGVWTDSSGNANNATYAQATQPALAAGVTPNGSPAVHFSGANALGLASSIPVGSYTVLAYIKPATGAGPYALLGGATGSFEYRIYNSKQDDLRQSQADIGTESTALSTSSFNVIDTIVTGTGTSFRLNGAADGTNAANTALTQPISAIGARATAGNEAFSGYISEIDVYSGVLTPAQIIAVEASFTNEYITIPPTAPILVANTSANPSVATVGGNDTLSATFTGASPISYQWFSSPNANGSGSNAIAGATANTLTLTNLQLANSGLYYSCRATNTIAPYLTNSSWLQLNVVPLTPLVQLIATNYDGSSVWADTSGNGNNATYSGTTAPTLASFATPNGGSAVNIASGPNQWFALTTPLAQGSGFTVFAYAEPSNTSSRHALTGGSAGGALEWDVYNGNDDFLQEYQADVAHGTAIIPTTSFSLLDLAVNSSTYSFRFNGASDGSGTGVSFSQPITKIGNNEGGGDGFSGDIAEIDIYSGALTYIQITNIEAQLTARYLTANNIVIGAATVSPTNNTFAGNPITLSAPILGATATTTFRWQTDNGTGGATFANLSGATSSNYVLNTSSLLGTYEYQLIGTPFGGNSVTSAPVTLTVQSPSAPEVLVDTAPNPANATINGNLTFSAAFVGNLPITYQWQVSVNSSGTPAVNIAGATNATLTLNNLQLTNSGYYYSLQARNAVSPFVANSSWVQLTVQPLTPLVELQATNYNPSSGVWSDSSPNGNNATYYGSSIPTLASLATPNGNPAVNITSGNNQFFLLNSSLDPSSGYTVFAYVEPTGSTSARQALVGGSASGALEWDVYNGNDDFLQEYLADVAHGSNTITSTNFSLIDLAVNSSAYSFRFNGTSDGSGSGVSFSSPITRIANNEGGGDGLVGNIAEIDIYNGVLTPLQISNVEAQLTAEYVAVSGIVLGAATVSPTNNTFAGNPVTLAAAVVGATGSATFYWQTDNGTGGAAFANISGATSTNYVLNTSSLLGTYEYQLVGTPFGGNSVTSAPVTLTVQSPSAPLLSADTAPDPATATINGTITFSAAFVGNLPVGYQWQVSPNASGSGAVNIPGATNSTLVLNNLQLTNSGYYYSLRATNAVSPFVNNSTWVQLNVEELTPLVQFQATNYNSISGVWTDSSPNANNATYSGNSTPALVSSATPNGSSVVDIASGGGSFVLANPLDFSSGYTVIAYIEPASTSGRNALTGGSSSGALEYDIYNGRQDYLREYLQDVGNGNATIPINGYSLVDLAVNSSGAVFRLDGLPDGSLAGATFGSDITRIGNNEGAGDSYTGNIAEIDIYSGALSSLQISNIEAQLMAAYGAVNNLPYNPTNITALVVGNNLQLSWPANYTGWILETQTNSLSAGLGTNWVPVANSTTVNTVTVPIVPGNASVFYRLQR